MSFLIVQVRSGASIDNLVGEVGSSGDDGFDFISGADKFARVLVESCRGANVRGGDLGGGLGFGVEARDVASRGEFDALDSGASLHFLGDDGVASGGDASYFTGAVDGGARHDQIQFTLGVAVLVNAQFLGGGDGAEALLFGRDGRRRWSSVSGGALGVTGALSDGACRERGHDVGDNTLDVGGEVRRERSAKFSSFVGFCLGSAGDDVLHCLGERGEETTDFSELMGKGGVRGRLDDGRAGVDSSRSKERKVNTVEFADMAESGEAERADVRADASVSFGGGKGVGSTSDDNTGDAAGENLLVDTGILGDAREERESGFAESAHGGDGECQESGAVLGAEFTVLVLLLVGSGGEDVGEGLACVTFSELVRDANINGNGVTREVGEENVGTVSAETFNGLGADLLVFLVGVVGERNETTTAVVEA